MIEHSKATIEKLEIEFRTAFNMYKDSFLRVQVANSLSSGEKRDLDTLEKVHETGLADAYSRKRTQKSQEALLSLVGAFCTYGPSSVLRVGSQRGGDFLLNQLRGQWAERVCRSVSWPNHKILSFGPSGSAMPGEEDHSSVVRTFREITLTEGKRPDLIVFDLDTWNQLSKCEQDAALEWPTRMLNSAEHDMIRQSTCGIEVKNSTWHYAARRGVGGQPLAVTIKDEEIRTITAWTDRYDVPVLFMQVLFDEVYCMSFFRMLHAISLGQVYEQGDYKAEEDRTTHKAYHKFYLHGERHRCANTVFPSDSQAVVSVLPNGYVIPHIRFEPSEARQSRPEVIETELAYRIESR